MKHNLSINKIFTKTAKRFIPICLALLLGTSPMTAQAETSELRIGSGSGIHYLPFYVMQRERLVEKSAEELGIKGLKVDYKLLSGGAAYNDALLSGNVDVIGSGVGPFAILWDKTRGHQNVQALAAMGDIPLTLLSNDPRIKSIEDVSSGDRIAVPAVKASMQATLLQIAAAKHLGEENYAKLDEYTVSMAHSDATTALMAGQGIINMHFSVAPYSTRELQNPAVHKVIDSEGIVGGAMTFNIVSMTEKFHSENPKVSEALMMALSQAMDLIKTDRTRAAQIYFEGNKGAATSVEMIEEILADPKVNYTVVPHGVGRFVGFMHKVGTVKNDPQTWQDMFFPQSHSLDGN